FVLRSPQPNQPALSDVIKPEGKAPRELNQENLWVLQQKLLNELLGGK
ncbi:MAG: ABC transporter ATP-binding protein, partial [Haemophilus parainfluenzae]|nr:ABC transporter ATP-binding protein [Haemophilus parainfluenzae]